MRNRALITLACALMASVLQAEYDPSVRGSYSAVESTDYVVFDDSRDRTIPLRFYLPEVDQPSPVVFFSHGLGGSRMNNDYLGEHWASHGYAVVYLQHAGSDEEIWKSVPRKDRMQALKKATGATNAIHRFKDVAAVLDALELWNAESEHRLFGKMDLSRVGMSGHSYGAVTTQAVSGQKHVRGLLDYTDSRIDAAVAFSPSSPRRGNAERAFSEVQIPWLLMTGTEDVAPIGGADVASRLKVFESLPDGDKYELVLFDAEHSAFSDSRLRGDRKSRNPNHHRAIVAISQAFWDAYLLEDEGALEWLQSDTVRAVLEDKDRWQTK